MKHLQKFHTDRGMMAIDPRALDIYYEVASVKETSDDNGIAIVSICGPLEHHASWMFDSYDEIIERLEAAFASDDCCAVVMCIDSPGGDAAGSTETHRQIQHLKKKYGKKLYAYSNESMYSAAYSIGSAADEIWCPETGGVGSVGVICTLLDKTKQNEQLGLNIQLLTTGSRKADTHADRELTDDVVASMQRRVDFLGDVFFRCVAKARGITPKAVKALQAGVFFGNEAVSAGLADGVAGWYKFLEYVKGEVISGKVSTKSAKEPSQMKTLAQLKKFRADIAKKLLSAKSADERTKLMASYDTATTELANFQAKTKFVKKTEERLTKDDDDEDDDDSDEEEEESEDEESEEEESDEESEDEDAEEDEEEEESEEEEKSSKKSKSKKAKALASASSFSLKTVDRLYKLAARATGKSDVREIFGALEGMTTRLSHSTKVETRLAKIEGENRKSRVKSMLDRAMKDGKITPAQSRGLEPQGMKDPKWLKGYLSSQPKDTRLRSTEVPDLNGFPDAVEHGNLTRDQQKMLEAAAASAGMSITEYQEQVKKFTKNPNGALPRS